MDGVGVSVSPASLTVVVVPLPECFTWRKDCHRNFTKWKNPPAK